MNHQNIILVGGGGHCKSVIDVAESAGWTILGVLDAPEHIGKKVLGYTIIGSDDRMVDFVDKAYFLVTVGHVKDCHLRKSLHAKIQSVKGELATIIASDAYVSKYAEIGKGSVIMHKTVVNAATEIGMGCIINTFANVEHDSVIGDFCHVSTGAMINGNCSIERETFIGSGAVVSHGVSVAAACVIGAGSVVRKNIEASGMYAGNPAVRIHG
jgi:sugar O-acyltransferase (sialic acid O-acetyltransferase NeuD family)